MNIAERIRFIVKNLSLSVSPSLYYHISIAALFLLLTFSLYACLSLVHCISHVLIILSPSASLASSMMFFDYSIRLFSKHKKLSCNRYVFEIKACRCLNIILMLSEATSIAPRISYPTEPMSLACLVITEKPMQQTVWLV